MKRVDIPHVEKDWCRSRLGDLCRAVGGGTPPRSQAKYWNGDIPWASVKDFTDENVLLHDTEEHISPEGLQNSASTLVPAGTPLVCARMAVGRCALTTRPTAINQDLKALLLNRDMDRGLFIRLLRSHGPDLDRVSIGSTVRGITLPDLLSLSLSYPKEIPEQSRIATVLDLIDAAIAKTEAVIAKLKQIRAGLVHDLLTCGLDANGQLRDPVDHPEQFKDSPVGRIPKAWEVKRLDEMVASAVDGPFGSNLKTEHYVSKTGVRVVRLQNIEQGRFDDADKAFVSEEHAATLQRHQVVSGDLLVASMGDENHPIARACLYPGSYPAGIVKADCFRLRMKPDQAVNGYVMHFMNCPSTRRDVSLMGQGVTRDRVNLTTLLTVRIARPQVDEQQQIVRRVEVLDTAASAEVESHRILQALKSGLSSDLLTGRVRVVGGAI